MTGKAWGIEERRCQHLLPQSLAERRQVMQVAGMGYRAGHVVLRIGCNPFWQTGIRQQTDALPRQKALARQGQHRHAHPQTFGAGGAARIGKRVEGDVHPLVGCQVLGPRRETLQNQPLGIDAPGGKAFDHTLAHRGVGELFGLEEQAALRQG